MLRFSAPPNRWITAPARLREARGRPLVAQQAEHGAKEHGSHPAAQVVVPCQPVPQPVRQTQHALPHRDVRNELRADWQSQLQRCHEALGFRHDMFQPSVPRSNSRYRPA